MRATGIPGLLGRIAVIGAFVVAVGLWALGQTSPAPGGTQETPDRRLLGNVKLISHTITTTATLTFTSNQPGRAQFTVTLSSSVPQCLTGRNVTVTRTSPAATLNAGPTATPGVYQTNNGNGRSGTWQASVAQSTATGYGDNTHQCSAATSNQVVVP